MGCPSMMISPASGCSNPARRRSVVVLPDPLGPRIAKNSPLRMDRERWSTATVVPWRLVTSRITTLASALTRSTPCVCPPLLRILGPRLKGCQEVDIVVLCHLPPVLLQSHLRKIPPHHDPVRRAGRAPPPVD